MVGVNNALSYEKKRYHLTIIPNLCGRKVSIRSLIEKFHGILTASVERPAAGGVGIGRMAKVPAGVSTG